MVSLAAYSPCSTVAGVPKNKGNGAASSTHKVSSILLLLPAIESKPTHGRGSAACYCSHPDAVRASYPPSHPCPRRRASASRRRRHHRQPRVAASLPLSIGTPPVAGCFISSTGRNVFRNHRPRGPTPLVRHIWFFPI